MPRTPSSLHWLINKHARLTGELNALKKIPVKLQNFQKDLNCLLVNFEELQAFTQLVQKAYLVRKQNLEDQIKSLESVLGIHEIPINPKIIPEIGYRSPKTHPASQLPYGAITRAIYECMNNDPEPATTQKLSVFIAYKFNLKMNDEQRDELKYMIRSRLRGLCRQKRMVRLHKGKGVETGRWILPEPRFS